MFQLTKALQAVNFRLIVYRLLLLSGPRVMDYKYQPEAAHRCKRDVLLCRLKNTDDITWKRIRPRPARNNFLGAFVLCKGMFVYCKLKR